MTIEKIREKVREELRFSRAEQRREKHNNGWKRKQIAGLQSDTLWNLYEG